MPFEELDLELAWRRVRDDRRKHSFVNYPHLIRLIEADVDGWLAAVRAKLGPDYQPHDCMVCECPKPSWLLRPGAVLDIEDEVVYTALLGQFHSLIWEQIEWSQGNPDAGYRLCPPGEDDWLVRRGTWPQWGEKSVALLESGASHVLFADVAGFYENIDLHRLMSDLRQIRADERLLGVLADCLRRWSGPRGKGIPQGQSSSNILAKLYMDPIDKGLRNEGFSHLRYVDDIRVFCGSELEARKALQVLNRLLRERGLNIHSAKTYIKPEEEARTEIDGVTPRIEAIREQMIGEAKAIGGRDDHYSRDEADEAIEGDDHPSDREVLERAFRESFAEPDEKFEATWFHYLLKGLAATQSAVAVDCCLRSVRHRPEETDPVLSYLSKVDLTERNILDLVSYLVADDAIYDYQLWQIVRWIGAEDQVNDQVLRQCRSWAFDRNRPLWLRTAAVDLMGKCGNEADLGKLESQYTLAGEEIEKTAIIIALSRMESGRRNTFLSKVKDDGMLVKRAVDMVRQQN